LLKLQASPGGVPVPLQTRHAKHAEPDASGKLRGFATPSRKVELYSETFLDHGYPPLPDFEEPQIGPMTRPDLTGCLRLVEIEPFHVAAYIKALKVRRRQSGSESLADDEPVKQHADRDKVLFCVARSVLPTATSNARRDRSRASMRQGRPLQR